MPQPPIDVNFSPEMEEFQGISRVWRTRSKSRPSMFHYTFLFDSGSVQCTCEGFNYNAKCWHIEAIKPDGDEIMGVSL